MLLRAALRMHGRRLLSHVTAQLCSASPSQAKPPIRILNPYNIGASITRVGFRGVLCHNYLKEPPPKLVWVIAKAPILPHTGSQQVCQAQQPRNISRINSNQEGPYTLQLWNSIIVVYMDPLGMRWLPQTSHETPCF